jgi:hypothetical protein
MKKNIFIIGGIAITGVLAYLFISKKNKSLEQELAEVDPSSKSGGIGGVADSILDSANTNSASTSSSSTSNNTEEEEAKFYLDKFNDVFTLWRNEMKTLEKTSRGRQYVYPTYYNHSSASNPCVIESKGKTWAERFSYGQSYGRKTSQYILSLNEYLCKLEGLGYVYTNGKFVKGSVLR